MLFRPDVSAVGEIQRKIGKQSKRNAVSRHLHAKSDKERIATWRLDLDKILHVFNVRSVVSVWLSLTLRSQTELVINVTVSGIHYGGTSIHTAVCNVHQGVANTHATVCELQYTVANTHTIVSDIHHTMANIQEGSDGKNRFVSDAHTLFIAELPLIVAQTQPRSAL